MTKERTADSLLSEIRNHISPAELLQAYSEPHINPEFDYMNNEELAAQFTPIELLEQGAITERFERLPIQNILSEEFEADENHADTLAKDISDNIQESPIEVFARLVEADNGTSKIVYRVYDGFHRLKALTKANFQEVKAIVKYGYTNERLYELRVLCASNVKSVRYTRTAQNMKQVFATTRWSEKVTLAQLANSVSNQKQGLSGSNHSLDDEEFKKAAEWLTSKAQLWKLSVGYIAKIAKVSEVTAPNLLANVRVGGGQKGELNPARLEAIALPFPHDHTMQNRIANVVKKRNLTAPKTRILSKAIKAAGTHRERERLIANPDLALKEKEAEPFHMQHTNIWQETKKIAKSVIEVLNEDTQLLLSEGVKPETVTQSKVRLEKALSFFEFQITQVISTEELIACEKGLALTIKTINKRFDREMAIHKYTEVVETHVDQSERQIVLEYLTKQNISHKNSDGLKQHVLRLYKLTPEVRGLVLSGRLPLALAMKYKDSTLQNQMNYALNEQAKSLAHYIIQLADYLPPAQKPQLAPHVRTQIETAIERLNRLIDTED